MTTSSSSSSSYVYECSCGERYNSVDAAWYCRKCRNYCVFGYCTHVVDIRDNSVVRGFEPSEERYAAAKASYERRIEAEREEWAAEQAWLEGVAQRGAEEAARKAAELEEDQVWDIQEKLMK